MTKRWQTFEHPSDLGLEAWGESLPALFEALGEALAAQICFTGQGQAQERVELDVRADDTQELLLEFLSHLLRLSVIGHRVITDVSVDRVSTDVPSDRANTASTAGGGDALSVHACVGLERVDLTRHELGPEIKAVTYHQLLIEQQPDGQWHARVLLDL